MRDTIDMAREAGLQKESRGWSAWTKDLQSFEALVRADEREACAKLFEPAICEAHRVCAAAIRARGENT
jgi:hypothetical protein